MNVCCSELKKDDDFHVDLSDPRFSKVLQDPSFHIDPTAAEYKDTAGMAEIVAARQKQRQEEVKEEEERARKGKLLHKNSGAVVSSSTGNGGTQGSSLKSLVESIKKKSQLNTNKKN